MTLNIFKPPHAWHAQTLANQYLALIASFAIRPTQAALLTLLTASPALQAVYSHLTTLAAPAQVTSFQTETTSVQPVLPSVCPVLLRLSALLALSATCPRPTPRCASTAADLLS